MYEGMQMAANSKEGRMISKNLSVGGFPPTKMQNAKRELKSEVERFAYIDYNIPK